MEQVNLATVIDDAAPALHALAERAVATLRIATLPSVMVCGSAPMLFRVVFNLVDNAIKHSGRGANVRLSLISANGRATLTVEDDGPGIAPAEQARIFERFYRTDPARRRGGAGLGLALVRSIVEVHAGGIDVESKPGQGTSFRVWLPLA
jgi:two-component system sensor histidine kinase SenX3